MTHEQLDPTRIIYQLRTWRQRRVVLLKLSITV